MKMENPSSEGCGKLPSRKEGVRIKKLDVPAIATNSPKNIFYLYLDILPLDGKLSTNN